jgi:hypothetical protein
LISDLDFRRFSVIQMEEDEESAEDAAMAETVFVCGVDFQWIFCLLDSSSVGFTRFGGE